jgi:nucleoside-diphosphate-sugar epimerase
MLGCRLVERLGRDGTLGTAPVQQLVLADIVEPERPPSALDIETVVADLAVPKTAEGLLATRPDVVFHLAAVVSGEAEADLERGYRVNLDGMRQLLEAVRAIGEGYRPRLVFASSIAVFGAPLPDVIGDDHCSTPLTSYGTQKAIAELLLSDYTRRGFVDGVGVRLPTICVRPGSPNRAVSGFFSSIIREPLNGHVAALPRAHERSPLACLAARSRRLFPPRGDDRR